VAQRTLVIANPRSRNGATGRRWRDVERRVREALGPVEVEATRCPRDAERLAREGARAGVERMLVAGGDGTLSEVVTGLVSAGLAGRVPIGVLPLGTGGDFPRTLGLSRDLDGALARIASGRERLVDAGRARFADAQGGAREACFVNVASFGISAVVDEIVNRTTKALGGTVSFLIGAVRAILAYECGDVRLRVDGALVHEGPAVLATAANGRYFGGGMHVAPEARLDDGLLDVVVLSEVPKLDLLRKLPLVYRGTHLRDPAVKLYRGRLIEAEAAPGQVALELDGEPLGALPATFELLPRALRLLGAAA
jgi:YegS/Rv2252/BmrU family lipid kinase